MNFFLVPNTKPGLWTMDWTVDWTIDWAFLIEMSCLTVSWLLLGPELKLGLTIADGRATDE